MASGLESLCGACISEGYEYCEDANAPGTTGVGPIPLNNPDGIRWSTSLGYLSISRTRLNLTIRANVSAKRIIFSQVAKKTIATGVEVVSGGETFVVEGDEIIMSAGAIASPQLLMLSGIGPKQHLERHGIECLIDAPGVGQNLRDQPLLGLKWVTKPEVDLDPLGPSGQVLLRYTAEGSSIENDMIVYMMAVASDRPERGGLRESPVGIQMNLCINLAKGKGEVKLKSGDYREQPDLDYNYLTEEEDRRRFRDGIKMLVDLENHPDMAAIIDERLCPLDSELDSEESMNAWMSRDVTTGHHISCTNKMGPEEDNLAVVDQSGRIHGADGIRVVDASIMPECVRANINVTVMTMAERIADMIAVGR